MDWRAKSRSRSRMSMDWRAASRSRSRAPFPEYEHNEAHSHALIGALDYLNTDPTEWNRRQVTPQPSSLNSGGSQSIPIPHHLGGSFDPYHNGGHQSMHTLGGRNFSLFNNGSAGGAGDVAFSGPGAYPSQHFASGSHSSAYEDAVRATSLFDQYPASIGGSLNSLGSGSRIGSERLNMLGGLQMTKGGGGGAATTSDGLDFGFGSGKKSKNGSSLEEKKSSLLVSSLSCEHEKSRCRFENDAADFVSPLFFDLLSLFQGQKRPAEANAKGEPVYASEMSTEPHDETSHFDGDDGGSFPSSHFTFQFPNGQGSEAGPSNGNYDAFFDINAASDSTPGSSEATVGGQSASPQTVQDSTPRTEEDAVADWFNINSASSSTTPISQHPSPGYSSAFQSVVTSPATEAAAFIASAASSFESSNGSSTSAADMESLMNLFYTANAASSSSPFATINPTQVLGSGPSPGGPSPNGSGAVLSPSYSSPANSPHQNSPHQHAAPQPLLSNSKRPIARPGLVSANSSSAYHPHPISTSSSKKKHSSSQASSSSGPSRSTSSPNLVGMNGMSSLASSGSGALGGPLMSQQQRTTSGSSSQVHQGGGGGSKQHRPSSKNSTPATTPQSETTTPEGSGSNASQNNGETPTVCSNCHTTNTPLWRRDPDGNPLCNVSRSIHFCEVDFGLSRESENQKLTRLRFLSFSFPSFFSSGLRSLLRSFLHLFLPHLRFLLQSY